MGVTFQEIEVLLKLIVDATPFPRHKMKYFVYIFMQYVFFKALPEEINAVHLQ